MLKKLLKYILLALFVVNLPMVALKTSGDTLGTMLSYSSFVLLIVYYVFFMPGRSPNYWMLYLGLAYFTISGLDLYKFNDDGVWLAGIIKYSILMLFGSSFFREVTKKEMILFLLAGTVSVMVEGFFIPSDQGRASGFYYNANPAGLACLFGYVLTYSLKNKKVRQILQIFFTIGGLVTFSRTFLIVWFLINIMSIKKSRKNIRIFAIGLASIITIFIAGELLNLGGERFESFKSAFSSEKPKNDLNKDSRTDTWSLFYEYILDSPILGNGYRAFQGNGIRKIGVHNTYLLIIGEAGIIPFIIFLIIVVRLSKKAWEYFKNDETLLYMSIVISLYLLTLHDFFEFPFMLSLVLFWFGQSESVNEHGVSENIRTDK